MQKAKKRVNPIRAILLAALIPAMVICSMVSAHADGKDQTWRQSYYARLEHCVEQIREKTDFVPEIVIVLGTGLGGYADSLDVRQVIPYSAIDGWPESTAPMHAGRLVFAEYKGLKLALMQGRLHFYEGYSTDEVVLPLRVIRMLGAHTLITTNAVGAMNPDYTVGGFVAVKDQITSFTPSPLIGQNIEELGERFTGMEDAFDGALQEEALRLGKENNIPVYSGIFFQVNGPQYETPAEVRMYRMLGGDTVGMSTGGEVIAARHMGMRVFAMNCISNMAAGMEDGEKFNEKIIEKNVGSMTENFAVLMNGLLDFLSRENLTFPAGVQESE